MIELNDLIAPVAESIKNTRPGTAYVTEDHQWLGQKDWGVSTESPDARTVYLHVMKLPPGRTLVIGPTADGSTLGGPAVLLNTGRTVNFGQTADGYEITLPENANWNPLDTVIRVRRV